ncbi:MAG TPA: hypothetical protein VHK68_05265 [Gemmatimonadales bacterium]|nr:hypothetical protein [Gemmatimonadales bacterium]
MRWSATSFIAGFLLCAGSFTPLHAQFERQDTPGLLFLCGWVPGPPATRRLIVDLALDAGHFNRTPNADDIRAVQAAGGHVLYQFRVAVLRAELDTGAIRDLIDGPHAIANAAYTVPDTSKYDAYAQIFYKRPITNRDEDALGQLGLSDRLKMPSPVIETVTPDSLIPRIAALPGVDFIRARSIACVEAQPSTPLVPRPHSPRGARSNRRLRLAGGRSRKMK